MDGDYKISIGNSRHSKVWTQEIWSWNKFVNRVRGFVRGKDTKEEWRAMSADQKADAKDVGGFIGGALMDGNRSKVLRRSMLCLDADFAGPEFVDVVEMIFGYKCVVYSTRSHDPENGKYRYRVVVPLAEEISVAGYSAACQEVMSLIGTEYFDKTSVQPGRIMYWPSCSVDGNVEVVEVEGELWKCSSGSGSVDSVAVEVDMAEKCIKQADPLLKDGPIGIFCREYGIYEAISTFLSEEYIAGNDGRYTYTRGTSTNGLIVYEDKFAYSHHESDPCSMMLCNAYDLVRIHKFGNGKNSIGQMNKYILSLPCIKSKWVMEKNKELQEDFGEGLARFVDELDYDDKGRVKNTMKNARILLSKKVSLKTNLLWEKGVIEISGAPWMKEGEVRCLEDGDYFFMYEMLEKHNIKKLCIDEAVKGLAMNNSYNPIVDRLNALEGTWDGVPRAETLFIDALGVEDNQYTRYVTKMWLAGCVQRMKNPGVQFDYMIVLNGPMGYRKSTLCSTLASGWFCNTISLRDTKDHKKAVEKIKNSWIVEFSELDGIKKTDEETIKNFISTRVDTYRPAYGRSVVNIPRRCVFIGTTNSEGYLRDVTGNRRFIPLTVTKKWDGVLDVDQIWAEVLTFADKQLLYMPIEIEEMAYEKQNAHLDVIEEKVGLLEEYLEKKIPSNWHNISLFERRTFLAEGKCDSRYPLVKRDKVCTLDIWTELLGRDRSEIDKNNSRDINRMLKNIGYSEYGKEVTPFYGKQRMWKKVPKV